MGDDYQRERRRYDGAGNLIGVTDQGGAVWSYWYDMQGNRIAASDPDLGRWNYEYNDANQLIAQTDARGTKTGLTYDLMGRLLERRVLSPVVDNPILVNNIYDEALPLNFNVGKLTTSTAGNRTERFFYGATGKVAKHQWRERRTLK